MKKNVISALKCVFEKAIFTATEIKVMGASNQAVKNILLFFIFIILAGNGSYSTVSDFERDTHISATDFTDNIPMFVPDRKAGYITYRIHPSLDKRFPALAQNKLIMSEGVSRASDLSRFLLSQNPAIPAHLAREIAAYYFEEAFVEGVNHDIAFSQMCLETGFLAFGGVVDPDQNNFCGLGAISAHHSGVSFPSRRVGVRAHIQHLKAYASEEMLRGDLADKRFRFVKRGSAPRIDDLTGRWASDPDYGEKIHNILYRLYDQLNRNHLADYPV